MHYRNCERIAAHWVAYDKAGFTFRVARHGRIWMARASHAAAAGDNRYFTGPTLRSVSAMIANSMPADAI